MLKTAHRVYSLLDEITSQNDTVYLLAAHNGISRFIESYFRDMTNSEFAAFGIGNCEIRRYDYAVKESE
ncbi:MAG: histidine phosphatase family protein [Solobacterium sp.]|nr:histidine phosphatase family protein [Solobacterium sp.]